MDNFLIKGLIKLRFIFNNYNIEQYQMYSIQQQNDINRTNLKGRSKRSFNLQQFKEQSDQFFINISEKIYPLTLERRKKISKIRTLENSPNKEDSQHQQKTKFPQILFNDLVLKTKKIQEGSKQTFLPITYKTPKKNFINYNFTSKESFIKEQCNEDNQFLEEFNNRIKMKHLTEVVEEVRDRPIKKPKIVRNNITKMFFQDIQTKRKLLSQDRSRKSPKEPTNQKMEYTFYGGKKFSNKTLIQNNDKMQFGKIIDLRLNQH